MEIEPEKGEELRNSTSRRMSLRSSVMSGPWKISGIPDNSTGGIPLTRSFSTLSPSFTSTLIMSRLEKDTILVMTGETTSPVTSTDPSNVKNDDPLIVISSSIMNLWSEVIP